HLFVDRQLGLKLGQLIIFELHQALQLFQLTLKLIHALFEIDIFAPTGIETFLSGCQSVAQRLGIAPLAGVTSVSGLASIRRNQAQTIAALAVRRSISCLDSAGSIDLTRAFDGSAPRLPPSCILLRYLRNSLSLSTATNLICIRQAKYLATLHSIDIAVDEGAGIQVLNSQHRLMH